MSSTGIWIVRAEAEALGSRLAAALGARLYRPQPDAGVSNRLRFAGEFRTCRQWVLVMASGIAVRYLQGLACDKRTDPAVVVLDEAARFAVPLLSGHEGGANRLAYAVANLTGAIPVITTATEALKPLIVGLGCRRGVSVEQIDEAVNAGLARAHRSLAEVRELATLDLKADEPALCDWCRRFDVPMRIIGKSSIQARPWVNKPSAWVQANAGVDGVCEPCALVAAVRGRLILPKTAFNGVAVAIVDDGFEAGSLMPVLPLHPTALPDPGV
ncbi:MAG: cobalamin biosynthesis protein [Verrucomicrobia bacterium]|nr:cobalamin biosynthesis protein [Verrucomicrobiota bacterium]